MPVSVDVPDGYRFLCWIQVVTDGWVAPVCPADVDQKKLWFGHHPLFPIKLKYVVTTCAQKSDLAKSFESVYTEITTGFTSPVKSGKVRISRWGKFCVVDIDVAIDSQLKDWEKYKICELPQSAYTRSMGICYGINHQRPVILQVDGTTLSLNTQGGTEAAADTYQGQVVYVS